MFFWGWKEDEWLWDGEKAYDVFQILHDEIQILVHLDLLLKIK